MGVGSTVQRVRVVGTWEKSGLLRNGNRRESMAWMNLSVGTVLIMSGSSCGLDPSRTLACDCDFVGVFN